MKALTILSAVALASSSAMALDTTMMVNGRFDYIRTETEAKSGTTTTKSSSGEMKPSFLKWATNAKFNDTTKVKLLLDFTKDATVGTSNGVSNFVEEAYLTKTMGDFSFIVGKQPLYWGGLERATSGRDLYSQSVYATGSSLRTNKTGVTLAYTFMDQKLSLQYLENDANETAPAFTDKKSTGIAYAGKFMDGMLSPVASYYRTGTNRAGQYNVNSNVGLRVSAMDLVFELDYMMLTQEKGGANASAAVTDAELNTVVAHIRYNHENFKPFFKYIMEEGEGTNTNITTATNPNHAAVERERNVWELGLEYVPNKDENMRYHVVYANETKEETTGTTKSKDEIQKIYAGVAFGVNVLN